MPLLFKAIQPAQITEGMKVAVRYTISLAFALALLPLAADAQHQGYSGSKTPYAGFETREIKGLSEQDIRNSERGGGWGLALPAELNGRPGPVHLLELQEEL